jgi:hypothetical protein
VCYQILLFEILQQNPKAKLDKMLFRSFSLAFALAAVARARVTISGLSSGADFASQFHLAFSSQVIGSAIFAGQAPMCAIVHFNDTR